VAALGQRRPVTSAVPMTTPSDLVCANEGGVDGIDAATPTSKPVAPTPPIPTRWHHGYLLDALTVPGKP
jgi:hypothetical protein